MNLRVFLSSVITAHFQQCTNGLILSLSILVTTVLLHNYFVGSIGFATGCWSFNAWGAAGGQEHMLNSGA